MLFASSLSLSFFPSSFYRWFVGAAWRRLFFVCRPFRVQAYEFDTGNEQDDKLTRELINELVSGWATIELRLAVLVLLFAGAPLVRSVDLVCCVLDLRGTRWFAWSTACVLCVGLSALPKKVVCLESLGSAGLLRIGSLCSPRDHVHVKSLVLNGTSIPTFPQRVCMKGINTTFNVTRVPVHTSHLHVCGLCVLARRAPSRRRRPGW